MMAPNRIRFGGRLLDTADDRPSTVADYDCDARPGILIRSRWGIGIVELAGGSLAPPTMQRDGTRFGGRLLNTIDNDVGHGV